MIYCPGLSNTGHATSKLRCLCSKRYFCSAALLGEAKSRLAELLGGVRCRCLFLPHVLAGDRILHPESSQLPRIPPMVSFITWNVSDRSSSCTTFSKACGMAPSGMLSYKRAVGLALTSARTPEFHRRPDSMASRNGSLPALFVFRAASGYISAISLSGQTAFASSVSG